MIAERALGAEERAGEPRRFPASQSDRPRSQVPSSGRRSRHHLLLSYPMWRGWRIVGPLLLLCSCAALFVGSDVVEHHLFPNLSTGWRHLLLTSRSALITAFGSAIVYLIMRRQRTQLVATANQLSLLLESYRASSPARLHFENPHLVRCQDVFDCGRTDCPMHGTDVGRCWQVMALSAGSRNGRGPSVTLQQCHECEVYRRSCPDGMTQLGESLNNLMFLLDEEAEQVRRMRAQMAEKEKMVAIGQMAAGIAHEIDNPLSSISAIVQMLKRKHPDPGHAEQVEVIQKHIQRISGTVRQLSTLARPVPERWELVDLLPPLEEAVRLISFDRRARRASIHFDPPPSLPRTYVRCGQMQQVFINILLNALDAIEQSGDLTVTASAGAGTLTFRFEDTGCGVPQAAGRRVFEPFFTTKEPGRGTGLGLAVSYAIVQEHGGTIDFVPRPGGGTIFRVDLPILSEARRA